MRQVTLPSAQMLNAPEPLNNRLRYAGWLPPRDESLQPRQLLGVLVAFNLCQLGIDDTSIMLSLKQLQQRLTEVAEQTHASYLADDNEPLSPLIVTLVDYRYAIWPGDDMFFDLATLNYIDKLPRPQATTCSIHLAATYMQGLQDYCQQS